MPQRFPTEATSSATDVENGSFAVAKQFLLRMADRHGVLCRHALIGTVLSGLTGGIGILMLIPLLHCIGVGGNADEPNTTANVLSTIADGIGFSLNIGHVLGAFVLLSLVNASLTRWLAVTSARLKEDTIFSLRTDVYAAINRSSWANFISHRSSDYTHVLADNLKRVSAGTLQLVRLFSSVTVTAVQLSAAVFIAPTLTLITLATGFLLWPLLSRQNRKVADVGRHMTELNQQYFFELNNCLSGMKETKSLGGEKANIEAFERRSDEIRSRHLHLTKAMANTSMIYTVGAAVLLSSLLFVSQKILNVSTTSLIAMIVVFSRVFPRLREIHGSTLHVIHMLPAYQATIELLDDCLNNQDVLETGRTACRCVEQIELANVDFRYSQAGSLTLNNISITIPAGKFTAIVGPSGAGKSTLVDLLLTLIQPTSGDILVDGHRLESSDIVSWRSSIGYVPQETFLFHGTIRENLLWARQDANTNDVRSALEAAAALDFVTELPNGLDTVVGDRGVRLSGGERQRIALARAILRSPSLIVLDEATSALDAENQQRIHDAVQHLKGKQTIVSVAHRLSSVRHADQIIVLDNGQVAESGTYEELAQRRDSRLSRLILADGETKAAA